MRIETHRRITSQAGTKGETRAQGALPDLVIDKFETTPAFPRHGDKVYLEVDVANRGTAPADAFRVRVEGDPLKPTEQSLPQLPAQESKHLRFGPFRASGGASYSFQVQADSGDQVPELDETNNGSYIWFSVEDPFPRDPWPPREPWPPGGRPVNG